MVHTRASANNQTVDLNAAHVDVDRLSSLLPDIELAQVTADATLALYKFILAQADGTFSVAEELNSARTELDEARAALEKKDVELDQALQDKDASSQEFEHKFIQANSDLESTRKELDTVKRESSSYKSQLEQAKSQQSGSKEEAGLLRQRVDDAEREKRDLLGVVARLQEDGSAREAEVNTLRANLKEARQDHAELESQVRVLRSTETSFKFKLETTQQQLALSQSSVDNLTADLQTTQTNLTNARRSKQAELSTLQASYDELSERFASSSSTLNSTRTQYTKQSGELNQALGQIQDLKGRLAEQEAAFSAEVAAQKKLVTAMEDRERETKEQVEGIEREWATLGERSEQREAALRSEIDRERQAREEAEHQAEQYARMLERINDPLAEISPTIALASQTQKAGKTFTEVFADYVALQEKYQRQKSEYERMDTTLSSVLRQIEERAPILSQQRVEYERLQTETADLASQLSQAVSDRDSQVKSTRDAQQRLTSADRENNLLTRQLTDLGRQVQTLVKENARLRDPSVQFAEDDEGGSGPAETTDHVISNNLVLFRSVEELQVQNQKLLKATRDLGDQLEKGESDYQARMSEEQERAVAEAAEVIQSLASQLENQKKSADLRLTAFAKEVEVLKSRLEMAPAAPLLTATHGPQINGHTTGHRDEEYAEIQSRFDAYRTETTFDTTRLRDDLQDAQRANSTLSTSLAKANAKIEYLDERQRISVEQYNSQLRENEELTKRNSKLYENNTKITVEYDRAASELAIKESRVEQLRNENANLIAEKSIWVTANDRLIAENKAISIERGHLSGLITNVQKMQFDLERAGEGDRRRLEGQIQLMESQITDLKSQVGQEREQSRNITLQKDIDIKELQVRLDTTVTDFARTRELLVGAETTRAHLQDRVADLSKHYEGMQQKLAVYERRQAPGASGPAGALSSSSVDPNLEAEVAELRSALKVAELDLHHARQNVVQFEEISKANENALTNLSVSFDEFKKEAETNLARLQSELTSASEKHASLQEEQSEYSGKYVALSNTLETERAAWAADRRTLEGTIVELSTSEKESEGDRASRERDAKVQEERAAAAEDRYTREVVSHAESIRAIDHLKQRLSQSEAQIARDKSTVETAQAKLSGSEQSWKAQREALDKELSELTARLKEVNDQNAILHNHLDSVTSQAARIQNAVDVSGITASADANGDVDEVKVSELRSVVGYLRKQKDIVDMQLELSKAENARFKSHIDHLSKSLEEVRFSLSEERARAAESAQSDAQHAELVERINQLNILRESNTTLRADCENYAKRTRELETKLSSTTAELSPIREEIQVARAELKSRNAQIQRLEEESRRWQERNTQLLSKYDRIDPAEMQQLKDEIESLKSANAAAESHASEQTETLEALQKKLDGLTNNINNYKNTLAKTNEGARNKIDRLNAEISTLKEQNKTLLAEQDTAVNNASSAAAAQEKLTTLQNEVETLRAQKVQLEAHLTQAQDAVTLSASNVTVEQLAEQELKVATLTVERDQLLQAKATWEASIVPTSEEGWVAEKQEILKSRDEAAAAAEAAKRQASSAESQVSNLKSAYEKAQARLADVNKARASDQEQAAAATAAAVKSALEVQKTEFTASSTTSINNGDAAAHAAELESLRQDLTTQHQNELKAAIQKAKEDAEKVAASTSHPQSGDNINHEDAIAAAVKAREEALRSDHASELEKATENGRKEVQAKLKLKDQNLVKTQTRLKEYEKFVSELESQNAIPATIPNPFKKKPPTPQAGGSAPAGAAVPTSSEPKPSTPAPAARGTLRGGIRGRGGPLRAGTLGRGGAPNAAQAAVSAAVASAAAASSEPTLSIIGASKRIREDGEEETLSKRLKPGDGNPAKGPVTIRRPAP